MDARFRLQDSWLGCNGIVGLALALLTVALALLVAVARAIEARAGSREL